MFLITGASPESTHFKLNLVIFPRRADVLEDLPSSGLEIVLIHGDFKLRYFHFN